MQGPHIVTVMELCCTDLHTVLQKNDCPLLPSVIKRLVSELLKGVRAMHLHGANTIHRTRRCTPSPSVTAPWFHALHLRARIWHRSTALHDLTMLTAASM